MDYAKHRVEIDDLVERRKASLDALINMSSKIHDGLPLATALTVLKGEVELPPEFRDVTDATDTEKPLKFPIYIPKGDVDNFKLSLRLYAVMSSPPMQSLNEALLTAILGNRIELELAFEETFKALHKYRELIWADKYACKLCGKIPTEPTLHHLILQSRCQGFGPVALLCAKPCHLDVVQVRWEYYTCKWLEDKDAVEKLQAAYAEEIREHGKVLDVPLMEKLV
jgi:hypothetical protein